MIDDNASSEARLTNDDDNSRDARRPPPPQREPRLDLIESCWQTVHTTSQHVLSCGIYRTDAGLEVRAGYSDQQQLRSQYAADITAARAIAEEWRQTTVAHGAFTALNGEPLV